MIDRFMSQQESTGTGTNLTFDTGSPAKSQQPPKAQDDTGNPVTSRQSTALTDTGNPVTSRQSTALTDTGNPVTSRQSTALTDTGNPVTSRQSTAHTDTGNPVTSRQSTAHTDTGNPVTSRQSTALTDTGNPVTSRQSTAHTDTGNPVTSRQSTAHTDTGNPLTSRQSTAHTDTGNPVTSRQSTALTDTGNPSHVTTAYGSSLYGQPSLATTAFGSSLYGQPSLATTAYGSSLYGQPSLATTAYGSSLYRQPSLATTAYGSSLYGQTSPATTAAHTDTDPDLAYHEARKKLKQRFGRSAIIATDFENKLSNWPKIAHNDAQGLRDFSDLLQQVQIASTHMSTLKIFEYPSKIQALVEKLPSWFMTKWSIQVQVLQQREDCNAFPSFADFVKEVTFHADRLNIPQITRQPTSAPIPSSASSVPHAYPSRPARTRSQGTTALASKAKEQVATSPKQASKDEVNEKKQPTQDSSQVDTFCFFHNIKTHTLNECKKFRELKINERKEFFTKNNLCFNCTIKGKHLAQNCDQKMDCDICHRAHATALHIERHPHLPSTSSACTNVCGGEIKIRQYGHAHASQVAIVCDIEQMFHSFFVNPEHKDFLRFLWFENNDLSGPIKEYRMNVHLFGATSSPGVANFCLHQTAETNRAEYGDEAADFLRRDFYVDDGLKSVPTVNQALELIEKSQARCANDKLRLHKFASNKKEVLEALPAEDRAKDLKDLDLRHDPMPIQRSLGTYWCIESDTFGFRIELTAKPMTRRGILSTISSVYDPLGAVSPVILTGKQILQLLCRQNVNWDDPIPESIQPRWEKWRTELPLLEKLKFPRCLKPPGFGTPIQTEIRL
ncbi:hypothetical protein QZH41_011858 [Actinostola sp. cb2023]|nr:hypothetical protein QZH41_011858 [Actinostola sp. cb2023]